MRSMRGSKDGGRGEEGEGVEGCAIGTARGEAGEGGVARVPTRREQAIMRGLRRSRGRASGVVGRKGGGTGVEEQKPSVVERFD